MSETAMQIYDRDSQVIELQRQVKDLETEVARLKSTVKNQADAIRLVLAEALRRMAAELDSGMPENVARQERQDATKGGSVEYTNWDGKTNTIRPDEFFGMTHAEASRIYLRKIGHAIHLDELVTALRAGGCRLSGDNPKKVLYMSLIRNTHDFRAPQRGLVGLAEFYERGKER